MKKEKFYEVLIPTNELIIHKDVCILAFRSPKEEIIAVDVQRDYGENIKAYLRESLFYYKNYRKGMLLNFRRENILWRIDWTTFRQNPLLEEPKILPTTRQLKTAKPPPDAEISAGVFRWGAIFSPLKMEEIPGEKEEENSGTILSLKKNPRRKDRETTLPKDRLH